jgi:hypothetical protein
MSTFGILATLRTRGGEAMASLASIAARLQKIEQALTPELITHVFEFVGFHPDDPIPDTRIEQRGPHGEHLVFIGFEPWSPSDPPGDYRRS